MGGTQQHNVDPRGERADARQDVRVLMVDDSRLGCKRVSKLLSDVSSTTFHYCTDAERAVAEAEAFSPTVILQDIQMPGKDGFELLRTYRKSRSLRHVPVLILSADEDSETKARAFRLGANDYLVKSTDKTEFLARIRYHSSRYSQLRDRKLPSVSLTVPSRHTVKVLLVDASASGRQAISEVLSEHQDITVTCCERPGDAVNLAEELLPTVVVLAMRSDEPAGFELLRVLRQTDAAKDVPLVALADAGDTQLPAKALACGADDAVIRAVEPVEFVSRIRSRSTEYFNLLRMRSASTVSADTDAEGVRVFMVDDSEFICLGITEQLRSEPNVICSYCTDPLRALEAAVEFAPTVILQDLHMPQLDGMQLLQLFREVPETRDVPIIVLSGSTDSSTKAKAFGLGANDYMEKKMDKIELMSRLQYHSEAYRNSLRLSQSIQKLIEAQKRVKIRSDFIRHTFGRYLSDEIVSTILETPEGLDLGGEEREVTLMMADLRGFTSLSERLAPAQVITMINGFLKAMTDILMKHEATIDEFLGDGILAIFGAPLPIEDHAEKAIACAVEMQLAIAGVNEVNARLGLPEVQMGIGLNSGPVVVGNIGCEKRVKYGVIGQNVNLAARIESCTCGGQILAAARTLELAGSAAVTKGEIAVELKGVTGHITLHDVCGVGGRHNLYLPQDDESGLQLLREPLGVQFHFFEGKTKGSCAYTGRILELSPRAASIQSSFPIPELANLVLAVLDQDGTKRPGEAFAKALPCSGTKPGGVRIRFTHIDSALKDFFASVGAGDGTVPARPIPAAQGQPSSITAT